MLVFWWFFTRGCVSKSNYSSSSDLFFFLRHTGHPYLWLVRLFIWASHSWLQVAQQNHTFCYEAKEISLAFSPSFFPGCKSAVTLGYRASSDWHGQNCFDPPKQQGQVLPLLVRSLTLACHSCSSVHSFTHFDFSSLAAQTQLRIVFEYAGILLASRFPLCVICYYFANSGNLACNDWHGHNSCFPKQKRTLCTIEASLNRRLENMEIMTIGLTFRCRIFFKTNPNDMSVSRNVVELQPAIQCRRKFCVKMRRKLPCPRSF